MTTESCEQCGSAISADTLRCPKCGYSPIDSGKFARKLCMIIGVVLTGTLIGAPIGLPMIAVSWFIGRQKRHAGATGRES